MERFILSCKLIGVALLVIVTILTLSVKDAHGFASATANFTLPEVQRGPTPEANRTVSQDEMVKLENLTRLTELAGDEGEIPGSMPPIPEPTTIILLGAGLAGLGLFRRKR